MQKLHIIAGVFILVIFALSGLWMGTVIPTLGEDEAVVRMAYRANHIYLMFSGVIQLIAGTSWRSLAEPKPRRLQFAGSLTLLLATLVLIVAFIFEPSNVGFDRLITLIGAIFTLIGGLMFAGAALWQRRRAA